MSSTRPKVKRFSISLDEMFTRAVKMELGTINVQVCAINDLIEMKKVAGRPKDLEDIKYLQGIQDAKNED